MDSGPSRQPPQVSHLIVPEPLDIDRVADEMIRHDRQAEHLSRLNSAANAVFSAGYQHYYQVPGGVSTTFGEDYVELFQVAGDERSEFWPFWGNRLYRSGCVTRRTVVFTGIRGTNLYRDWIVEELRATMIFADVDLARVRNRL